MCVFQICDDTSKYVILLFSIAADSQICEPIEGHISLAEACVCIYEVAEVAGFRVREQKRRWSELEGPCCVLCRGS